MNSSKYCLVLLIALAGCKHTGASSNDAAAKSDAVSASADGGTSTTSSMSSDAGMSPSSSSSTSSSMPMSADAGTAPMPNGSSGSMSSSSGSMGSSGTATTASDAAKSAASNGTAKSMDSGASASGSASTADAGPEGATSSAKLSDAQIAGITAAAHQSEIDAAKLARKNSKNAKVRGFAAKMIKEHTAAMKEETALAKKAGLTPEDSDQQSKLKQSAQDSASKLEGLKGRDFDKAYVQGQVDAHQQVLDMIDNTLLPAAQSAELRAQITKERPTVASHLEHAQKLAADLGAK